nr:hypothetical protein CFP56_20826 [Quercus suber]
MLTRTRTLKLKGSSEIAATIDSSPSKTSAGPVEHFRNFSSVLDFGRESIDEKGMERREERREEGDLERVEVREGGDDREVA